MTTGGYSDVARELTRRFHLDPPLKRQQVHLWNKRRTVNSLGREFPSPVRDVGQKFNNRRPRLLFDIDQVASWYSGGTHSAGSNQHTPVWR
ncbi:MAG TPA: hypothetical protein VGI66_03505 [Streptosporangiaceae bacterium]|jgi:hypothetical protein